MRDQRIRPGVWKLFRFALSSDARARADADAELEAFIEARVEHLVARGVLAADAKAEVMDSLGAPIDDVRNGLRASTVQRDTRLRRRELALDMIGDVNYAVRSLRRAPAFSAVIIVTLGVAIGGTTTLFSAFDALVLRTLPFRDADRLMHVSVTMPDIADQRGMDDMVWSYPQFVRFQRAQPVFEDLSLYGNAQFNISTKGDGAERIAGEWITSRYLPTLGLSVERGRNFDASMDAHVGADRQAIISDALWRRRFNADAGIVSRAIDVNGEPFTIVGVAPPGFSGLSGAADIFVPVTVRSAAELSEGAHAYYAVARRKPGVSVSQAQNVVAIVGAAIDPVRDDSRSAPRVGVKARPLDDARVAPLIKRSVTVLLGAAIFVLLIAGINVANLLVGRGEQRRRELALRLALGAGRGRLVRLLLVESLVLGAAGALLGVVIAWIAAHFLAAVDPAAIRLPAEGTLIDRRRVSGLGVVGLAAIRLDTTALVFAAAIALAVSIAFGLLPAVRATDLSLTGALKSAGRRARSRGAVSGRSLLIVVEVALSIVLLAGSGLMLRSLANLLGSDRGFSGEHVLTARIALPSGAMNRDSLPRLYTQLHDRLAAIPGVSAVAAADTPPLTGSNTITGITVLEHAPTGASTVAHASLVWATPGWFELLHISLESGRFFTPFDRVGAPPVVLVNEVAAHQFWPGENPIGKRVAVDQRGLTEAQGGAEVVGVVGNVRTRADSQPGPTLYVAFAQFPQPRMIFFLRTAFDPASIGASVRKAVQDVAPQYPVYDVQTMRARIATATAQPRFTSGVLGLFSIVALVLAAVGIYGVVTVLVTERRHEIGIRMAVGADARKIIAMVVGQSLRVTTLGTAIGLVGALALTRVMRALLFAVTTTDPPTYVVIVLVFGLSAALASWIPARRAARLDPLQTLRSD